MSDVGRYCTSADLMNPDSTDSEPIYLTYNQQSSISVMDMTSELFFSIATIKEYTLREDGVSWYLKPKVKVIARDDTGLTYNVESVEDIFTESEYFVAYSNFIDSYGTYVGYAITNTGMIEELSISIDTYNNDVIITRNQLSRIGMDSIKDAIIYDVLSVNIYTHYNTNPITNELITSTQDSSLLDVVRKHISNGDVHFSDSDRRALMLRETIENVDVKLRLLKKENENYAVRQIKNSEERLEDVEESLNEYTNKVNDHIENEDIHVTLEKKEYWDNKEDKDHTHFSDGKVKIDAKRIVSGIISMDRIPKGARERVIKVENYEAMLNLTIDDIQNGDRVSFKHVADIDEEDVELYEIYEVADETKLATRDIDGNIIPGSPEAFETAAAGSGAYVDWANVENKPNTIAGYGIEDAYTKPETEEIIDEKIEKVRLILDTKYNEYNLDELYAIIHNTDSNVAAIERDIVVAAAISEQVALQQIEYAELVEKVNAMAEDLAECNATVDSLLSLFS